MSKNNAKKTLFNYQKTSKKNEQIQQKTLLHYMKVEKPILERVHAPKSNIFVTQQMIKGERLK